MVELLFYRRRIAQVFSFCYIVLENSVTLETNSSERGQNLASIGTNWPISPPQKTLSAPAVRLLQPSNTSDCGISNSLHIDMDENSSCSQHPLHPKGRCPFCDSRITMVYFTKGGNAFHANKACPSLTKRATTGIESAMVQIAKSRGKQGCHQCVNGVCVRCATDRHIKCSAEISGIKFCVCAENDHYGEM